MEILLKNERIANPQVSIILLDWSCRESFHSLCYLNRQTVPRHSYEIMWIEYYGLRSPQIRTMLAKKDKEPIIDQWIVMDMPDDTYYHKHLMYNIGIVKSRGQIVVICDSDAIYSPTFIESIIKSFQTDMGIVLHMDQVRNTNKKFYPFSYPKTKKLFGKGCVNFRDGKTTGLWDKTDPMHSRNYGACMAAERKTLIDIGGADEHIDFLGHVCGPYDMTFRLKNFGKKEVWHEREFLYHTWHPGQSGDANYVGPHDGKLLSTRALEAIESGRVEPVVENETIRALRTNSQPMHEKLINPQYLEIFNHQQITKKWKMQIWHDHELICHYKDYNVIQYKNEFYGVPAFLELSGLDKEIDIEIAGKSHPTILAGKNKRSVLKQIKKFDKSTLVPKIIDCYNDFNIVKYGKRIYGLPIKMAGGTDFHDPQQRQRVKDISADTLEGVRKIVDRTDRSLYYPIMLKAYKGHNIIRFQGQVYGIPESIGKVDIYDSQSLNREEILVADTVEAIKEMIDMPYGLFPETREHVRKIISNNSRFRCREYLLYEYKKHNIIRYDGRYYAVPQSIGNVDFSDEKQKSHPEIISADNCEEIRPQIDRLENTVPIEYLGWLPPFQKFGNCGFHPQFAHIKIPPQGYRFTYSQPRSDDGSAKKTIRLRIKFLCKLMLLAIATLKLTISALTKGAKWHYIRHFIRTRDISSQLLIPRKTKLLFLPSVPYTLGLRRWVIEIEDPISLLFPFVHNGQTSSEGFDKSPYFPIFKALLESKNCKNIITHVKSTAENLPKLFQSSKLADKIEYIPIGIKLPAVYRQMKVGNDKVRMLFNNSFHQDPRSFFIRGGLDVLSAFDKLHKIHPETHLIIRTALPEIDDRYMEIIERNQVELIDSFLPVDEWESLMSSSDIYLLPSDRIHVISTLEAMSYGLAVVVSDGWGVQDYIEHERNGIVVKGRYGKVTWMDEKTGMLCEDYEIMRSEDTAVVKEMTEILDSLVEDKQLRNRLGTTAREDVKNKYNLKNWNKELKKVFDRIMAEEIKK
ncbi:MAG: glycosyltransferase [Anaerohalosphaeraceae bacterium]|nr:glycosyltransferase [Anaerohalosphaeraceae bacterium]